MPKTTPSRAAVYTKESAGYPDHENSRELQTKACEAFCLAYSLRIFARYHDSIGDKHDFHRMMEAASRETPTFEHIIVCRLRNFSWSLEETVVCHNQLAVHGVSILSTIEGRA